MYNLACVSLEHIANDYQYKMKVIIIYDSVFGNTREIADAIHQALKQNQDPELYSVDEIGPEKAALADMLIVGSPTRSFRPTPAIVRFIKSIPKDACSGKPAAAFDTRIKLADISSKALRFMVKKGGYAAKPIAAQLIKKGGKQVGVPEGFYVKGEEGPLYEREIARARDWAKQLIVAAMLE